MKNAFGTETTTLNNDLSLKEALTMLSGDAESLVAKMFLDLDADDLRKPESRTSDPRGVEIVTDEEFDADVINEVKKSGLFLVHTDSNDEVTYISANKDVFYAAASVGLYVPFDLCP